MNYMTIGYENLITISLAIVGTIIVLFAQIKVKSSYSKYKKIPSKQKLTGFDVARKILDNYGLDTVHIVETPGELTDHYDPNRKVVRLSTEIFHEESVASIAVAAHECGHAIQDKENYSLMRIRSLLVPVVNFISGIGFVVILISLIAGMMGYLIYGILMILTTILFQIVTLPVEIDASKRALSILEELHLVEEDEKIGVKVVLTSAAMTYIASVLSSLLSLFRLIIMLKDDN